MFTELVISTSVVVGKCNTEFDINSLYSYLNIDNEIIMLKCNNKQKTKTSEIECKTFYNQISISMYDKKNLKLFNNGKFQVSGVKSVEEARELVEKILEKVKKIKGRIMIKPQMFKGMYQYKNKILTLDGSDIVCTNMIKGDKIIINNREVEVFGLVPGLYIDKKHENKTKRVYNNTCNCIGILSYDMVKKSKNLCIKDVGYVNISEVQWDIVKKNKHQVGVLRLEITDECQPLALKETEELVYRACDNEAIVEEISLANSNSNIKLILSTDESINRDKISSYLKSCGIEVNYDPSRYPGIKFFISKTKVTMFRTGSILFSSKENIEEIVLPFLQEMFVKNDLIKRKREDTFTQEGNLSIWDI